MHHRNYEQRFLISDFPLRKKNILFIAVDRIRGRSKKRKMSEPLAERREIKSEPISCDKDKSKQCNKFSIENILGLNDDVKANRLGLIDLSQKGKVDPCRRSNEP